MLVSILAAALVAAASPSTYGQRDDERPILERLDPQDWTVRVEAFAGSEPLRGRGGIRYSTTFELRRGLVVFPVIAESASSETHTDKIESRLRIDNVVVDDEMRLMGGYPFGQALGRWDVHEAEGRTLRLTVNIPVTAWSTRYNEARARKIDWPSGEWPPLGRSSLDKQLYVETDHQTIQRLAERWTEGQPRSVPPAVLAKQLAGKALEYVQPVGQGVMSDRLGRYAGMEMTGAAHTALARRGSPHDMAAFLCAIYRAAGLPARVVIGYDVLASLGREAGVVAPHPDCGGRAGLDPSNVPILHTWVEFYLYDEQTGEEWWIPVDIVRMREFSTRTPPLNRAWKFFGSHECLNTIVPLSFHYHPPTSVVGMGAPALWGWLPIPRIPAMEQVLVFDAMHTPKRSEPDP